MINNIMNIGRYDKTNIYIHSLLKFKSKRLVYFLDGYETWEIIVLFIFVDRIKIKNSIQKGFGNFKFAHEVQIQKV